MFSQMEWIWSCSSKYKYNFLHFKRFIRSHLLFPYLKLFSLIFVVVLFIDKWRKMGLVRPSRSVRRTTPSRGVNSDGQQPHIHPTKYAKEMGDGSELKLYEFIVCSFLACVSKDAEVIGLWCIISRTYWTHIKYAPFTSATISWCRP